MNRRTLTPRDTRTQDMIMKVSLKEMQKTPARYEPPPQRIRTPLTQNRTRIPGNQTSRDGVVLPGTSGEGDVAAAVMEAAPLALLCPILPERSDA